MIRGEDIFVGQTVKVTGTIIPDGYYTICNTLGQPSFEEILSWSVIVRGMDRSEYTINLGTNHPEVQVLGMSSGVTDIHADCDGNIIFKENGEDRIVSIINDKQDIELQILKDEVAKLKEKFTKKNIAIHSTSVPVPDIVKGKSDTVKKTPDIDMDILI